MSLKMSCNIGIAVSSHPRPKAAMATNRVKPIITPAMCGQVARKPKLALEAASRRLLGPGVKAATVAKSDSEISSVNSTRRVLPRARQYRGIDQPNYDYLRP